MLKSKRLMSCIICFAMLMIGIPFSAEDATNDSLVAQDQAVFQKADSDEISATFSSPTVWKQQITAKNNSLQKIDLTHDTIQSVLDQSGITGLSKYQYYLLLSEEGFEDFVPNQLLVSFSGDGSTFASPDLNALVESKEEIADLFYTITFKETYTQEGLMALLEQVIGDSQVVMAQPNFLYQYDQYYPEMDHGDSSLHAALEQVNVPTAWNYATGENVKIGMIDSGVTNGAVTLDSQNIPDCVGDWGHGSFVAMVMAGDGRQLGVAPNATVCCRGGCLTCMRNGYTFHGHGKNDLVLNTVTLVTDLNILINSGYRIINLSLSFGNENLNNFFQYITNNPNILFIQAAGNLDEQGEIADLDTDTSYTYHNKSNYIRVAAVDRYDNLASFSKYGDQTVHIAAPGVGLIAETPLWGFESENTMRNGTSFATPFVSGAAALLLEVDSTLTAAEMKNILLNTADTIDQLSPYIQGGRRLNVGAAVTSLSPDYSNRYAYLDTSGVLRAKDNVNTSWVTIATNVKSAMLDTVRVYYLTNDNKLYYRKNALTSSSIALDTTGTITDFSVCGASVVIRKGTTLYCYTLNATNNTLTLNKTINGVSLYTLSGNMLGYILSSAPKRFNVDTQIHSSNTTVYYKHTFDGNISNVFSIGCRFHLLYGTNDYAVCDITNYDNNNLCYSYSPILRCYNYYDYNCRKSTGIARRAAADGTRLNIYRYDGTGHEVNGGYVTSPNGENITAVKVIGDRILFLAGSNLYIFEGDPDTASIYPIGTNVSSFNTAGNMIGVIKNNGNCWAINGDYTGTWFSVGSNVSKIYLAP